MNQAFIAMFEQAAEDLMTTFGCPGLHTHNSNEVIIQMVFESILTPVGEFGERMESRYTITVAKSNGVVIGDICGVNGVNWVTTQTLEDDGFAMKFAVRQQEA